MSLSDNGLEWLDGRIKERKTASGAKERANLDPNIPIIDAGGFAQQITDLAETLRNKVEREGPSILPSLAGRRDWGLGKLSSSAKCPLTSCGENKRRATEKEKRLYLSSNLGVWDFRDEITPIALSCRIGWNLRDEGSPRRPHLPIQTALLTKLPRSWTPVGFSMGIISSVPSTPVPKQG